MSSGYPYSDCYLLFGRANRRAKGLFFQHGSRRVGPGRRGGGARRSGVKGTPIYHRAIPAPTAAGIKFSVVSILGFFLLIIIPRTTSAFSQHFSARVVFYPLSPLARSSLFLRPSVQARARAFRTIFLYQVDTRHSLPRHSAGFICNFKIYY